MSVMLMNRLTHGSAGAFRTRISPISDLYVNNLLDLEVWRDGIHVGSRHLSHGGTIAGRSQQ